MSKWATTLREQAERALQAPTELAVPPPEAKPAPATLAAEALATEALAEVACPYCHRPTVGRKCWKDHTSICACGQATESAFLSVCRRCEVEEYRRLGTPY